MQRQDLEHKFEQLMRDRNEWFVIFFLTKILKFIKKKKLFSNSEKSAIKSIKSKYKKFMEADTERSNRNSTLMKMLERIDYQAATLAAKTERLKLLKVGIDTMQNKRSFHI